MMMPPSTRWRLLASLAGLGAIVLWAYGPALWAMTEKWFTDPQYSHGFFVPAFAAYLLWRNRDRIRGRALSPSIWGLLPIGVGVALHLSGGRYYYDWLDMIALLPVLAGLCLCYGGWPVLRWAWPSIAFLIFMLPLPFSVEIALSHPLQRIATLGSTYALQTLGYAAVAEGNIIHIDNAQIGVITACNGLGMLVTFFALTTAVAIVLRRPVLDRIVIVLSAIPIALIANLIRITGTGILHVEVGGEFADWVFHELGGWLMMPLALAMLWLEVCILTRLLVEPEPEEQPVMDFLAGARTASAAKPKAVSSPG